MTKHIVTGAAGFIGTALCRELIDIGDEVFAVVRPNSSKVSKLPQSSKLHICETTIDNLTEFVKQKKISADIFFHLAWNGTAGAERENFATQAVNIRYMQNILQASKICNCRKFVGAGSQAEYGVVHGIAKENTPLNPFMMYGAAKVAAYQMGRVLATQMGIDFLWSRIYSVYGAGENSGTLISYLVQTLTEGKTPELSHCENMWNFLYVDDCAKILAALGKKSTAIGIYNVASDDTRPLKSFVEEFRNIIAPNSTVRFGTRTSDPRRTFWLNPDITKMKASIDVNFTSFATGIRRKLSIS